MVRIDPLGSGCLSLWALDGLEPDAQAPQQIQSDGFGFSPDDTFQRTGATPDAVQAIERMLAEVESSLLDGSPASGLLAELLVALMQYAESNRAGGSRAAGTMPSAPWTDGQQAQWGANASGQSGGTTSGPSSTPVPPVSLDSPGLKYNNHDLITGWHQTSKAGNCVEIGAIKGAMAHWGPDKIFASVKASGDGYDITMRDGYQEHLSNAEYQMTAQRAGFDGPDQYLLGQANLAFAAMAKRNQQESGFRDFGSALDDLDGGGKDATFGPHLLGLDRFVHPIAAGDLVNHDDAVGYSADHVIFGPNGVMDSYGVAKPFDGTDTFGNSADRRLSGGYYYA